MINTLPSSVITLPKGRKRVEKRDNHLSKQQLATDYVSTIQRINAIMLKYNLQFASVRDLSIIYSYYIVNGCGIRSATIKREAGTSGNTYRAMYIRLLSLTDKGLILNVSRGIYIPTDKAIKELS